MFFRTSVPLVTMPAIRDISDLKAALEAGWRPSYLLFWGHRAPSVGEVGKWCLSQWWPSPFEVDGVLYRTAEHFMMAEKARLFHDEDARREILVAGDPATAKKIGRRVKRFHEGRWSETRKEIVLRGNREKFRQNPALEAYLLGTGDAVLVEASPTDRVWGIGLRADHIDSRNPMRWPGANLLGFALMEVRRQLRSCADEKVP